VSEPITKILSTYFGKPALVIGGGPSARFDLPVLDGQEFKPAVVISANEHGLYQGHYKVDFLVNVDKMHCARHVYMEEYLRQFDRKIINSYSWADYRLPDWKLGMNSGLTAIAVACLLGCWPVVVTGVDLFFVGRNYYHDPDLEKRLPRPTTRGPDHLAQVRVNELRSWTGDYPVRPVSGPLTSKFPTYNPAETFLVPKMVDYRRRIEKAGTQVYRCVRDFPLTSGDRLQIGELVPLSKTEAAQYVDLGWLELVGAP